MKKQFNRLIFTTALLFTMTDQAWAQEQAQAQEEGSFNVTGRYTAQRRPRVTVLDFQDTNTSAQSARYGSSVQAMLVTFLKRKSQLVVVERQKLDDVLEEWRRNREGMTNLQLEDPTAQQLLEKIDAIIIGNVTLLDVYTEANVAGGEDESGAPKKRIGGPRIEIDAKLLSRADGRIIAAAQRRGPVACLRSIVERLGIALEQEFLRPYYGSLKISLTDTDNVRVYLTPILLDTALDEEKPPVERSSTVIMGSDQDIVEPWMTDPTTYTIQSLLSGWYSMRIERPGYDPIGTSTARWQARDTFGHIQIHDTVSGLPLQSADPDLRRFVVQVDPLDMSVFEGDKLGIKLRKKQGALGVLVKRQHLDKDFVHTPQRIILIGGHKLEINEEQELREYADDEECDLFDERSPGLLDYGPTHITSDQRFDIESFKGGRLIIENYKGESVPVGEYQLALWEPRYELYQGAATVRDQDANADKTTRTTLTRETWKMGLTTTGQKPAYMSILQASETGHKAEVALDFTDLQYQVDLPVDTYTVSTNIPSLGKWRRTVDLLPPNSEPPIYDKEKHDELDRKREEEQRKRKEDEESGKRTRRTEKVTLEEMPIKNASESTAEVRPPVVRIKTRLCLGGRIGILSKQLDAAADDLCQDRELLRILNILLYGSDERPEEENGSAFLQMAAEVGKAVAEQVAVRIVSETPATAQEPAAAGAAALPETPPVPVREARAPLPRDPEVLRALLALHLEDIDLLVLDGQDMSRLRDVPEIAATVARYVEEGGALYAFVSDAGDYGHIVGAPLLTEVKDKETDRFDLAQGEVSRVVLRAPEKKVKVKKERILPELVKTSVGWRVIAFTKGRKTPRIIERGNQEQGGYVVVWLDDAECFSGRRGGTVPEVEDARQRVEEHSLYWARLLMARRLGGATQRAENTAVR